MNHRLEKFISALCIYAMLPVGMLMAQEDVMSRLKTFFDNIAAYNHQYTQEKVYLHLDNNGYFPGETIWFKAYVMGAATLLPTDMSKVLYLELLTPEGEVVQRKKYPVINGRTCGDLQLKDIIHTGYYEVRAYTRAMLNWDESYIFSRVIPVFDAPNDSLQYGKMTMYNRQDENDCAFLRPIPAVLKEKNTLEKNGILMNFYPEGGYITKGISSKVAFKITDKAGNPLMANVCLKGKGNVEIENTQTIHDGMGLLSVPAEWEGGIAEVKDNAGNRISFTLPTPRSSGCDISTTVDISGNLSVMSRSNVAFPSQVLGVCVTCRGVPCYFDTISISPSCQKEKRIPYKQLHDGIHQVSLFTSYGELLSERLVWIPPHKKPLQFTVAQNAKVYNAFSPIVLDFTLSDAHGFPIKGEFSLSVHDVDGELGVRGEDICVNLLLSSDLKGYIHRPEYFFESKDEGHQKALDLLLMVQGFRRYVWKEMAGISPFVLKQPVEDGLLVDGRVVDNSSKHNGKEGVDVNLMVMLGNSFVSGNSKTAADGSFALLAPDFYGQGMGYFSTLINGKRKSCNVALNRGFSPPPFPYEPRSLSLETSRNSVSVEKEEPQLFQWVDTLPKIIHLPEVGIKEKQKLHPYGSRFTWLGGESAGKRYASIYYNVEDALEKLLDKGEREDLIWNWLAKINPNLVVEISNVNSENKISDNPILTYKGSPVVVLTDNDIPISDINYFMSEIRSLIICEQPDVWMRFNPSRMTTKKEEELRSLPRPPITILLYTRLDNGLLQYRKGQRITPMYGYSKYEEFYSPDYRSMNSPDPSDVRRTLYWNPSVVTNDKGKAQVLFLAIAGISNISELMPRGLRFPDRFFLPDERKSR